MNQKIRVVASTEPKIRLTPSTEPPLSVEEVVAALGAEPVGPASPFPGLTFAQVRARVAAVIAERRSDPARRDSAEFAPDTKARLHRLAAELRNEGLAVNSRELAEALVKISMDQAETNRPALVAILREALERSLGQSG